MGGLAAVGLTVSLFVLTLNPAWVYRRWLMIVIPFGLYTNALGGVLNLYANSVFGTVIAHWTGNPSAFFNIAWAIVICALVYGDIRQFGILRGGGVKAASP